LLKSGYAADVVIFDPQQILDLSTFEKPHAYSTGMYYVIVNGQITVDEQKHNGTRAGQLLYGPGKSK
jgi:N-acyl-D-amino-acid deacylase